MNKKFDNHDERYSSTTNCRIRLLDAVCNSISYLIHQSSGAQQHNNNDICHPFTISLFELFILSYPFLIKPIISKPEVSRITSTIKPDNPSQLEDQQHKYKAILDDLEKKKKKER